MFIAKIFKRKYEAKLEFSEECEGSNQELYAGGVWIFCRTTHREFPTFQISYQKHIQFDCKVIKSFCYFKTFLLN